MSPEDWMGLRHQQQTVPFPFKITVRTSVGPFLKSTYCRAERWLCCPGASHLFIITVELLTE
jgi:hypothetical protein